MIVPKDFLKIIIVLIKSAYNARSPMSFLFAFLHSWKVKQASSNYIPIIRGW